MNNLLKRKITDALQLNNIYKKFKSTKFDTNLTNNLDEYNNNNNNNTKKRKSKNKNPHHPHNHHNQYTNISNNSLNSNIPNIPNRKEQIPKRIREMVWSTHNGEKYSSKCYVSWCNNIINVFNYQVGHDVPESKGGTLDLSNLKPICGNCNLSMGNKYTITEWCTLINKNTLPIIDTKNILKSQLNIMKNSKNKISKNEDANKIITKSLQHIEDIIDKDNKDKKDIKDGIPDLEDKLNNDTSYNKVAIVALLIVILNIMCF